MISFLTLAQSHEPDLLVRFAAAVALLIIWLALNAGLLFLIHFLLTLPMRRAERARLFLDLTETALDRGQPIEEALVSISHSRDQTLGLRFHLLAAELEKGLRLGEALARTPRLLPPQITAMLQAGQKIGDMRKVLPACRQLLKDALSQTRGAINYLVILGFVITPVSFFVYAMISVKVLPAFLDIAADMEVGRPAGVEFLMAHRVALMAVQSTLLLLLWLLAVIYVAGPRSASLSGLDHIHYRLPWRRKRMLRDFSAMLAVLLDAGVPEPEALTLAARCTANTVVERRAGRTVDGLKQGLALPEAVRAMDDSGEFRWRLANACHTRTGFLQALAGWHEALDAKAFQQEQTAAHEITTALVLLNGLFVGTVVVAVFMFLVSIVNAGLLW